MWQLWAESLSREESFHSEAERAAALSEVHNAAVAAGVWLLPQQRPAKLFRELSASVTSSDARGRQKRPARKTGPTNVQLSTALFACGQHARARARQPRW